VTPQLRRRFASVALILGFFLAWELLCLAFGVKDIILPRPSQIVLTLGQRMPAIWPHALQTLYTTLVGFALGIVAGVLLGAFVGSSKLAYDVAYPLLVGFSSIPKVAVVPIFVLWFGAGTIPAVLTAMILCVFPIVVNVATGLATTEPELEDVMKALKASKLDILTNVGLPRTMPYFFASLKVAVTQAFVGTVIAETVRLVATDVVARESIVETELDPQLPEVKAAPVQLQQVLLNLIVNALDAMESRPPGERRRD